MSDTNKNDKMIENQIILLTKRVYQLEQQVNSLQKHLQLTTKDYHLSAVESKNVLNSTPNNIVVNAQNTEKLVEKSPEKVPNSVTISSSLSPLSPNVLQSSTNTEGTSASSLQNTEKQKHQNNTNISMLQNIESFIGNNLMTIVAAVLIFIGLITFGTLIYDQIPAIAKVVGMFIVSFILTYIGLRNMTKSQNYKTLYTSFAACGICAIYITSLISYFTYELLPMPVLIGIIILWLISTGILSKSKSIIFMYICNVGLLFTTILGFIKWDSNWLFATLYIAGLSFIYLLHKSDNFNKDCHVFIQLCLVSLLCSVLNLTDIVLLTTLYIAVTLVIYARDFLYKIEAKHLLGYSCSTAVWLFYSIIYTIIYKLYVHNWSSDYCTFILAIVCSIYVLLCNLKNKHIFPNLYKIIYCIWILSLTFTNVGVVNTYASYSWLILLFLGYGFIKDHRSSINTGLFFVFLFMIIPPTVISNTLAIISGMIILIICYIYNQFRYQLSSKYTITTLFIISFSLLSQYLSLNDVFIFIGFACISVFMKSKYFTHSASTKKIEKYSTIISYVYNALIMIMGTTLLLSYEGQLEIWQNINVSSNTAIVIISLVTLILFCLNVRKQLELAKINNLIGYYICAKFTVLLILILYKFSVISIILSVSMLVFSIACIVCGFIIKLKAFRMYGLIVAYLCVAKLIIFDFNYDSNIEKPIAFVVAGLLCYGISWLYAKLNKNIENK